MQYNDLLNLIDKLDKSSVAFVDYQTSEGHVVLAKSVPNNATNSSSNQTQRENKNNIQQTTLDGSKITDSPVVKETTTQTEEAVTVEGDVVPSPMVGVVYLQPTPDAQPYVEVGQSVEKGQVVCIIEAMKLMNEIQAPVSGIVTEILVANESVVEFDQPLLRIKS